MLETADGLTSCRVMYCGHFEEGRRGGFWLDIALDRQQGLQIEGVYSLLAFDFLDLIVGLPFPAGDPSIGECA